MAQTLQHPGPADVNTLVARMRALESSWPRTDGVAVFHRAYLSATEEPSRHVPEPPTTLDVHRTERYLAAVDTASTARRPPACWRPLFQHRRHPGVRPMQFALSGINAHVGHDLALAIVDACRTLDCQPTDLEGEFDRVGDQLTALEERIREDLMPGPDLLEVADPLTHLVSAWNLERAREAAWSAARVLWGLRDLPELAEEFRGRMDDGIGLVGRCLLTPWR
ncbi:DUF5995 family protein [Streptomyces apocyni]|uniref:DUF5995 family protein n=1 Tax=Streptomyces apocyni TaxID=2654677 RepID=UPI0012EA33D9|nr:DUF5995 family protein [Streptomyces apocyni]